ncbi:MAG: amidohydrolase family protein [Clostridiales bacterium]|nr:MAG: amidohydrolase family protein [Clostridiales bacterium]
MDCVKTAVKMGIPKNDAMRMATETPSTLMSINKGKITVGYDADILLCDSDLNVKKSYDKRRIFFR